MANHPSRIMTQHPRLIQRNYLPVMDDWMMLDNSGNSGYELIAAQVEPGEVHVVDEMAWQAIREAYA